MCEHRCGQVLSAGCLLYDGWHSSGGEGNEDRERGNGDRSR